MADFIAPEDPERLIQYTNGAWTRYKPQPNSTTSSRVLLLDPNSIAHPPGHVLLGAGRHDNAAYVPDHVINVHHPGQVVLLAGSRDNVTHITDDEPQRVDRLESGTHRAERVSTQRSRISNTSSQVELVKHDILATTVEPQPVAHTRHHTTSKNNNDNTSRESYNESYKDNSIKKSPKNENKPLEVHEKTSSRKYNKNPQRNAKDTDTSSTVSDASIKKPEVTKYKDDVSLSAFKLPPDLPEDLPDVKHCCRAGSKGWCVKYFWEGQNLHSDASSPSATSGPRGLLDRYRRAVGLLLPAVIFHVCWWGLAIKYSLWHLFPEKYYMTLCMIAGSIVAGMTSEGGGAIAFPVMTLAFNISPSVARDFSLMIQSCGMTAAAISIFIMQIQIEYHALTLCSLGGAVGIIFGLYFVDPYLSPAQKKMGFVSIWFSFAFALFLLNRMHKRKTFGSIPHFHYWKAGVLLLTGIFGGIFSSFAGSGLDICSFSMLTLLFRVSEKVATPTSVVLMAGNTVVGFYWRGLMSPEPISQDAWDFLAVCVPVVVLGAPLGSVLGSHFHRQVLAALVYVIDVAALVGAFVLVPLTPALLGTSIGIILGGFTFFMVVTYIGHRLMLRAEEEEAEEEGVRSRKDVKEYGAKDSDDVKNEEKDQKQINP